MDEQPTKEPQEEGEANYNEPDSNVNTDGSDSDNESNDTDSDNQSDVSNDESSIGEESDEPGDPDSQGDTQWETSGESTEPGEDTKDGIKVAVDWVELEGALENNSPDLHSYLNTVTGDVIRIFEAGDDGETPLKQAEASPDFLYVEPVSSREQYRWMEEFIETVEESTLKDKLNIAIDGKGAFRRFKDVLVGYPAEREKWFEKRSAKLREHMNSWLASKHVVPTNTPPWEGDDPTENRGPRGDVESKTWHSGSPDLRTQAHELIDMVPSRELPTAVTFLEFLRNRKPYKRPRYS